MAKAHNFTRPCLGTGRPRPARRDRDTVVDVPKVENYSGFGEHRLAFGTLHRMNPAKHASHVTRAIRMARHLQSES